MGRFKRYFQQISILLIRGYQYFLKPILGERCRFLPTCSDYAIEAIQSRGFLRGWVLTAKRLSRCHPLAEGGCDPVSKK